MKKIKTLIAIVLASALVVGMLSGCGQGLGELASKMYDAAVSGDLETDTISETETTENETTTQAETETENSVSYNGLEYEHYDTTEFLANCDKIVELAKSGDTSSMLTLYDSLYEEVTKIDQLYTVASLIYAEDVTNTSNQEESEYAYNNAVECEDAFCTAIHEITETNSAKALKEHINDDRMYNDYVDYEVMTSEQKELFKEETELQNDYIELAESFENYDAEENAKAGEIYVKLLKIRTEIAKSYGYDNYADYADKEVYMRDYDASDLESMKSAVKSFGLDYEFLYSMAYYSLGSATTDTNEFVEKEGELLSGISPLVDNAWNNLKSTSTYSIGSESSRQEGAFTTTLEASKTPFIYAKLDGTENDYVTFTHEFGHYTQSYANPNKYWLTEPGSYDLFEIHSNGLELLANSKMSSLFEDADKLAAFNILFVISNVVDGCIYDDFQRQVYENPDWTLDEINNCFKQVMLDYGETEYDGMEYAWIAVSHNFTSPCYYISYATSAYAALQIWELAQTDFETAVQTWEKIVSAGAYDDGYMTVVKDSGLSLFTDGSKVSEVLNTAYSTASSLYGDVSASDIYSIFSGGSSDQSRSNVGGDGSDIYGNYGNGSNDGSDIYSYFGNGSSDGSDIYSNYGNGSDIYNYYGNGNNSGENSDEYYEQLEQYLEQILSQYGY